MRPKKVLRIYKWIIISVTLQMFILLYFNNIYLSNRGEATATLVPVDGEGRTIVGKDVISVPVPDNAQALGVSFDNGYVSYILDGKLEIIDAKNKKPAKTITTKKDIITNYRWLADRNTIIYSVRTPDNEAGAVQVITYNMDSDVQHDYTRITGLPAKSEIVSIELSHLTNSVYAKVKTSQAQARIYRYNVMSQLFRIADTSSQTVIKEMHYEDKLVYQDDKYKIRIFTWNEPNGTSAVMPFSNKMALIGVVGVEDEIYLGEMNDENKIVRIVYGKSGDDPEKQWKTVSLKTPASPENMLVTPDGTIYELIENKNMIYNITENTRHSYTGKLIEVTDKHIVCLDNKTLKITTISKE